MIAQAVFERLERIGFTFHTSQGGELAGKYWYCWCGPSNKWDTESGPTCDTHEAAVLSALDCLIAFTKDLDDRLDEMVDE